MHRPVDSALGVLAGMGIPDNEARRSVAQMKDGGALLAIHCAELDAVCRAQEALRCTGATEITASSDHRGASTHTVRVA